MAACHVRSISLPTSRSHPVNESLEEQINSLKTSQSICTKLSGLRDLYDCVDNFLQLQKTHQTLSHESNFADEALNGSLVLLDMCSTTRDVLSQTKECVQELESSLRRRRSCESRLTNEVDKYISSRKTLNKVIFRCLKNFKRKESSNLINPNQTNAFSILRDVEDISFEVFQYILSSISQPVSKPKVLGWSVVSKLIQIKRVSCESKIEAIQTKNIDNELLTLKSSKEINNQQVQSVLKALEAFESSIQEMEEEMECAYRHLVKARVSLLNILNC